MLPSGPGQHLGPWRLVESCHPSSLSLWPCQGDAPPARCLPPCQARPGAAAGSAHQHGVHASAEVGPRAAPAAMLPLWSVWSCLRSGLICSHWNQEFYYIQKEGPLWAVYGQSAFMCIYSLDVKYRWALVGRKWKVGSSFMLECLNVSMLNIPISGLIYGQILYTVRWLIKNSHGCVSGKIVFRISWGNYKNSTKI